MANLSTVAGPAPTPAPGAPAGPPGAPAGGNGEALRAAHDQVVAKHGIRGANAGSFKAGGIPWNKGSKLGAAPDPAGDPAPVAAVADTPVVPAVDPEAIREMVTMGLTAIDETLRMNLAEGWYRVTGDKDFSQSQAEFHGATEKQKQAVALFAGLCAQKYALAVQYLPEIGLLCATGGLAVGWLAAFNKLKQAAALVAASKKTPEKPAAPAAPEPPKA